MNRHFRRVDHGGDFNVPKQAFGRLDHVELPTAYNRNALLAFDLVDAQYLLDQESAGNALFAANDYQSLAKAWVSWKPQLQASPFEDVPLFRLEVELPISGSWFGTQPLTSPRDPAYAQILTGLERTWFSFSIENFGSAGSIAALIYPNLFGTPKTVWIQGSLPSTQSGRALSHIFSLGRLPAISMGSLAARLSGAHADYLAAYDVGQGNANALLDFRTLPHLHYDHGAGVYRNRHTTPTDLVFCYTAKPPILLSHWDADHWAGAYATQVGSSYPALKQQWIAPMQVVGPLHVAFAHDVIANGGTFETVSAATGSVASTPIAGGRTLTFAIGTGQDRNGTGLVIVVENSSAVGRSSWLLTGDCDYGHFAPVVSSLADPVGLVAPHHGANLMSSSPVPAPSSHGSYRRLIFSFGKDNAHGSTGISHPTALGVDAHSKAGWGHGTWNPKEPGCPLPGADLLATCEHAPGAARGGALIGWHNAPIIAPPPCGSRCTARPTQS